MFTLYKIPFRGVSCINSMNSNSPGWHKSFTYIKHRAGTLAMSDGVGVVSGVEKASVI